jgi:hypothetical protein
MAQIKGHFGLVLGSHYLKQRGNTDSLLDKSHKEHGYSIYIGANCQN